MHTEGEGLMIAQLVHRWGVTLGGCQVCCRRGDAKDQPQKKAPEVKGAKAKSSPVVKCSPAKRTAPA